jgi:hypothetical protein
LTAQPEEINRPFAAKGVAMQALEIKDDPTWDAVMDCVSSFGNLSKFYRLPRPQMNGIMKTHTKRAAAALCQVFSLTQAGQIASRDTFLKALPEECLFAMLLLLGRSMKCWIETESGENRARTRWKVASA